MRSALCRLSYPAARLLDRRKLAHKDSEAPLCVAPLRVRRHDRKNLRHNIDRRSTTDDGRLSAVCCRPCCRPLQSPRRELNSPPLDYQSSAPPSELRGPITYPIGDWRLPIAPRRLTYTIDNQQSATANSNNGPRGSRTHYPSIKSRELILMSFRPK
jgi:hypothetical protein